MDVIKGAEPDIDKVTLIIATTRSGSSLLCQDVRFIGGLGRPNEYYIGLSKDPSSCPENDVLERIACGRDEADPTVGAVKLMTGQAPKVCERLGFGKGMNSREATHRYIDWAQARFDAVNLIVIIRMSLMDQAISRAVAKISDVYHSYQIKGSFDPVALIRDNEGRMNELILQYLNAGVLQRDILEDVARNTGALRIEYEDLASDLDGSTDRLVAHARGLGFAPRQTRIKRKLRKLVVNEASELARRQFRQYLQEDLRAI